MAKTKAANERISELVNELKSNPDKASIEQCLALFLERAPRNGFHCPDAVHSKGHGIIKVTNSKGAPIFGCFGCGTTGRNPIDVFQMYGGSQYAGFQEATIGAALELGLITSSEASELQEGGYAPTTKIVPKKAIKERPVSYWYEHKEVDPNILNTVYTVLGNMYQKVGTPKLSKKHLEELTNKRHLSMDEINKIGFFTLIDFKMDDFIGELNKLGYDANSLKYVSGFYYNKKSKTWHYNAIKGEAYGIPIRDTKGRIVAIQVRLTGENISMRYIWISSKDHMLKEESPTDETTWGNTPGTPFCVVRPEKVRNGSVLVTEGFYKAYTFAREYGCVAIAVQGVRNFAGIENVIDELKSEGLATNVMVAFDADMAVNENVLKPALQIAARIGKIDEKKFETLQKICMAGEKTENLLVGNLVNETNELVEFFKTQTHTCFLVWDMRYEKGIDDLIFAGNKDKISPIKANIFCEKAFRVLKAMDSLKWEQLENGEVTRFRDAYVPDDILRNLFNNIVLDEYEIKVS